MKKRFAVAAVASLAIVAISGCPSPNNTKTPVATNSKAPSPNASAALKAGSGQSIMGTVKLPTGYNVISTGGGNFISTNGGTVVPTGGGNVISTGGGNMRAVLKVEETVGNGAVVTLVDEDGDKVAGVAAVTADADGNYAFKDVPAGTYKVEVEAAKGKQTAVFDTIVEAGDTNADVNAASTIVTAGVIENLDGDLDQLAIADFEKAVDKTEKTLETADLPDFTDEKAVLAKFDQLSEQIAELKTLVEELSAKIDELNAKIDALTAQLTQQSNGDCGIPDGLDANGDGGVTMAEFKLPDHEKTLSPEEVFRRLDISPKDGKIVKDEFCFSRPNGGPQDCNVPFADLDADRDGFLTQTEFKVPQNAPEPANVVFPRHDINGDGKLSISEFCTRPAPPTGQTTSPGPVQSQQPPMGNCGDRVAHVFVIKGYTPKAGDVLVALNPMGQETPHTGPIQNGKATVTIPEICAHKFRIKNGTQTVVDGTETINVQSGSAEVTLTFPTL